jgi:hypothetical protein
MDINNIHNLGPSGYTLSMEEKAAMSISMLQRSREVAIDNSGCRHHTSSHSSSLDFSQLQENLGKLMFWGKLLGETNDYLIAYALIPSNGFPSKKFFYW